MEYTQYKLNSTTLVSYQKLKIWKSYEILISKFNTMASKSTKYYQEIDSSIRTYFHIYMFKISKMATWLSNTQFLPTLVSLPSPTLVTTGKSHRRRTPRPPLNQSPIVIRSFHRIHKCSISRVHFHELIRRRVTTPDIRMQNSR